MAIAIDAQSNSGNQTGTTSALTWSHTCASGARLYVMVSDSNAGGASRITGVTYNNVALTNAFVELSTNAGSAEIWYIDNPATGANTIQVNASLAIHMIGGATSFTGASSSSLGATAGNRSTTAGTTSLSQSITTTAENSYIVACLSVNGIPTITATGTNQTQNFSVQQTTDGDSCAGSTQTTTSIGSYTDGFSFAGNSGIALALAEVKPSGGGGSTVLPFKSLLGVGM